MAEIGARRIFSNLKSMKFTPWTNEEAPGSVVYDISNIVGDTTSLEQADPEVNEIPSEFTDAPLYENTNLGNKTFSCECIDMQNVVLKELFGWEEETTTGSVFAPKAYKSLYCKIELAFNSTDDIIVLPKVKMNSKAALASLRTDVSRGTLSGTCYSAFIKVGTGKEQETDMAIIAKKDGSLPSYTVTGKSSASSTS